MFRDSSDINYRTIEQIQNEYKKDNIEWSLGFSGGKDSSALLKLTYIALYNLKLKHKPLHVIYCDTGVEIPMICSLVKKTLRDLLVEANENEIPIILRILVPPLKDRYFAKVIGHGYPPPTNKFRWCTDRLRIRPIQKILKNTDKKNIILLGIRKDESIERNKAIIRYATENEYFFRQSNNNTLIFSPIIKYTFSDVWHILINYELPKSIQGETIKNYYNSLNSENTSNHEGRLGCWTCTVIRKDRAVENLIANGYKELEPLLAFRNWLIHIREDRNYRCKQRRNGANGPGPFTIEARKEILNKLIFAQNNCPWKLIDEEEIEYIKNQWELDMNSSEYLEK